MLETPVKYCFLRPAEADWQNVYELLAWKHLQDFSGGGFALSVHCSLIPSLRPSSFPCSIIGKPSASIWYQVDSFSTMIDLGLTSAQKPSRTYFHSLVDALLYWPLQSLETALDLHVLVGLHQDLRGSLTQVTDSTACLGLS